MMLREKNTITAKIDIKPNSELSKKNGTLFEFQIRAKSENKRNLLNDTHTCEQ